MGGLERAGPAAVASLTAALRDSGAVVRANAAEMLGWLKPAGAVADLAPLLSDPDPSVRAQAAWALGEIGTGPARLALIPAPILAPIRRPSPTHGCQPGGRTAPGVALPETLPRITADNWTLAVMMALFVLVLLAIVMVGKGPGGRQHSSGRLDLLTGETPISQTPHTDRQYRVISRASPSGRCSTEACSPTFRLRCMPNLTSWRFKCSNYLERFFHSGVSCLVAAWSLPGAGEPDISFERRDDMWQSRKGCNSARLRSMTLAFVALGLA